MAARGRAEAWLGVPVVKCECRRSRSHVEIRGRRWRLFGRMSHGSLDRLSSADDAMNPDQPLCTPAEAAIIGAAWAASILPLVDP